MRSVAPVIKRAFFQLLFLLCLYSISRVVFTLINLERFSGLSLAQFLKTAFNGLRFDIAAICTINLAYLALLFLPVGLNKYKWWRQLLNILFIATNLLAFAFEVSDWAYYGFTNKRATADVLDMISRKGDFLVLLPHFVIDYWYVFIAFALLVIAFIKVNKWICSITPLPVERLSFKVFAFRFATFILVIAIGIIGARGGLQASPLAINAAVEHAPNEFVPIVLNTPFSIITTTANKKLPEVRYYSDEKLAEFVDPVKMYSGNPSQKRNVVIIILESFSKHFTGLGKFKSYTPYLDSLMQHSFVCRNAYANALHSAEGIPAIVAGIPSLMNEPFTSSIYSTNRITALPALLKEIGYNSAFYHGATNGTMNFDVFCANAGFDKYYGRAEYDNEDDYDGSWGIWDEPYLQYAANELSQHKQPFFASVFTLSSHDPYKVPEKYKEILPKGEIPAQQSIAYTDMALRRFFETASKLPYFNNTLFVFTADHCSLKTIDDNDNVNMGFYRIPIFFYAPGDSSLKGTTDHLMQQIDILPSIMDRIGYDQPFFAYGKSIFRNEGKRFVVTEHIGTYQMVQDNYILKTKGLNTTGVYNYTTDSFCYNNLIEYPEGKKIQQELEPNFKAFVQLFNSSLIHNKMHIDKYRNPRRLN